jgi:hypothetical protein
MSTLAADAAQLLSSSALADAESAAYWAYHLGRTGFFLGAVSSEAVVVKSRTLYDSWLQNAVECVRCLYVPASSWGR